MGGDEKMSSYRLLKEEEVSEIVGVPLKVIRRLRELGLIHHYRIPTRPDGKTFVIRYRPEVIPYIHKLLKERTFLVNLSVL